jgi:peptidoglycan/LPS O-acetylase OafA/YrhL
MATGAVRLPGGLVRGAGWAAFAIVIAMVAALTVDDAFGAFFNYGGYTLFAVVAAVLIGSLVLEETGPLVAFLTLPVMVWIGRISYALYLWHLPIFRRIQDDPTTLAILACVVASFTMATLSWYFVERPCLRLKDRITSTPRASRRRALAGTRRMSES